jgi:endonuclease/exonuclease/phosphatase family metal-dependent hydrolase
MIRLLLVSVCLAALGVVSPFAVAQSIRVMTFNVKNPTAKHGPNMWSKRRDLMIKTVRQQHPDVMGTQELYELQGDYLVDHLKHYKWFGEGRYGNNGDEHMGVFYRTNKLDVLKSGNFWLSDTPNVPGSKTGDQPFPRMVTWALFKMKSTGKTFYYYNTHFPYRKRDTAARIRAAKEIVSRIKALPDSTPFVLTGDFNTTPTGEDVHKLLTQMLHDAWIRAPRHSGPKKTFHGFTGKPKARIDWILYRGLKARSVRTVTTHSANGRYPSDHFPVVAELAWPSAS